MQDTADFLYTIVLTEHIASVGQIRMMSHEDDTTSNIEQLMRDYADNENLLKQIKMKKVGRCLLCAIRSRVEVA